MRTTVNGCIIELVRGDITEQAVDAVVNAANSQLAGGGGVDGAIHRAGGPTIMQETDRRYPDGCPTGSAVITAAGSLAAKHVIHAVGPFWSGRGRGEDELLAAAYQRCLELAVENDCQSIAFPSLSTGAYRFPVNRASRIAVRTVRGFLNQHGKPALVRFVLFSHDIFDHFASAVGELCDDA